MHEDICNIQVLFLSLYIYPFLHDRHSFLSLHFSHLSITFSQLIKVFPSSSVKYLSTSKVSLWQCNLSSFSK